MKSLDKIKLHTALAIAHAERAMRILAGIGLVLAAVACTPADVVDSKVMAEPEAPEQIEQPASEWGIGSPVRAVTNTYGEETEVVENVFAHLPVNTFCLPRGIHSTFASAGTGHVHRPDVVTFFDADIDMNVVALTLVNGYQNNTTHQAETEAMVRSYLAFQNMTENVDYELETWQISGGGFKMVQIRLINSDLSYHDKCEELVYSGE